MLIYSEPNYLTKLLQHLDYYLAASFKPRDQWSLTPLIGEVVLRFHKMEAFKFTLTAIVTIIHLSCVANLH